MARRIERQSDIDIFCSDFDDDGQVKGHRDGLVEGWAICGQVPGSAAHDNEKDPMRGVENM